VYIVEIMTIIPVYGFDMMYNMDKTFKGNLNFVDLAVVLHLFRICGRLWAGNSLYTVIGSISVR
jgi:hypothetical protein